MKKHLSVFGLFARSSIYKVLLILLGMCIVEAVFFYFELQKSLEAYGAIGTDMSSLERIFTMAATNVYFRVTLVVITIVICLPGCEFKSITGYTLRRLSVSERATFFHQAAYNALVYIILFAVQLATALGLAQYYVATVPPECISNQTLMLAFYRNDFLHSLLPLEDVGLWIRNGLLILSFALAAAEYPYKQRRNKFSATALALGIYTIVYFDQGIGALDHVITTSFVAVIIIGVVIYSLINKGEEVMQDG